MSRKLSYNLDILPPMVGNITSLSGCSHKVHRGAGAAYGETGNLLLQTDMLQVGFRDKKESVPLGSQVYRRRYVAGLQFDVIRRK